jgi:hypothetical protein
MEEKHKKEKVHIVVVEKRERGKSGGESQKPRPEYHRGQ